jgi:hypothetical protein
MLHDSLRQDLQNEIKEIKDRIAPLEQALLRLADTAVARVGLLLARLRKLIADPRQHQSDTDWAEVEDLLHQLRPVSKCRLRTLLARVSSRLNESRDLLKHVAGHRAAFNQLREAVRLLAEAAGPGDADVWNTEP